MNKLEEMHNWDSTVEYIRQNATIHSRLLDLFEAVDDVAFEIKMCFNNKIAPEELAKKIATLQARIDVLDEEYIKHELTDEVIFEEYEELKELEAKND